jgi:hypothetical protein
MTVLPSYSIFYQAKKIQTARIGSFYNSTVHNVLEEISLIRYIKCSFKFPVKFGVEDSIAKAPLVRLQIKNTNNAKSLFSYPTSTPRHGNFAGVHTLLRIILSSNSAVLINIITGVSPPHFDFFVFYVLCQC